jgi:glucose-6-phosphate 1-dehydrogenase
MDHYLGKAGVDDLRQLRRSNPALEGMWNAEFVDRVEISAREKIGIEGRGSFYQETGALRDFVQGHLIQLLTVTGMDLAPDGEREQQAKTDVVRRLRRFNARTVERDVVRMQYDGYRAEPGVAADSKVETYVAMRAHIDNPRWQGVPFFLETGKALGAKNSSIRVHFWRLSPALARKLRLPAGKPAVLEVALDPRPSITLRSGRRTVALAGDAVGKTSGASRSPYARILLGAIRGEHNRFVGRDEALQAWEWLRPVQRSWAESGVEIARHRRGIGRPKDGASLRSRIIARSAARSRTAEHTRGPVGVASRRHAGRELPRRFPSVHRGSPRTHASPPRTRRSRPPRTNIPHPWGKRSHYPKRQIRPTPRKARR